MKSTLQRRPMPHDHRTILQRELIREVIALDRLPRAEHRTQRPRCDGGALALRALRPHDVERHAVYEVKFMKSHDKHIA